LAKAVERFLGIDQLYSLCRDLEPTPETFSAQLLGALSIRTEWRGLPLSCVPSHGPLIVVSNHPYGLIEGLALDAMLLSRRTDVTVMVWHMVAQLPGTEDRGIYVDPLRLPENRTLNVQGFRKALELLGRGGALLVFPSGQVARYFFSAGAVVDPPWNPHVARLARRTKAQVLPIYFEGHNGLAFQLAALALPRLHQSLLIREVNNKRGFTLQATLGPLIAPDQLAAFATDEAAIAFLRSRTYALAGQTTRPTGRPVVARAYDPE